MARRLATVGYFVMLPNLYYRAGRDTIYGPDVLTKGSAKQARMRAVRTRMTIPPVMDDVAAMIAYADRQAAAKSGPVGTHGYCMSGPVLARRWSDIRRFDRGSAAVPVVLSVQRSSPRDRQGRWPRSPACDQMASFLQPSGAKIRPLQRGFDQVNLGPAAAHALAFGQQRNDQVDRRRVISPLERGEGARRRGDDAAGGIATGLRQVLDGLDPGCQRRFVTCGGMRKRDMPVGEGHAGAGKPPACKFLDFRPEGGIARLARQFRPPKKRNRVRQLLMDRAAMIVRRERVGVEAKSRFQMPRMHRVMFTGS